MFKFDPIGHIRSDFVEKFGIPRQPGLSPNSEAAVILEKNQFNEEALRDLEGNSHIWLIFVFNALKKTPDKARIRPPRLGGNKFVGVYSSRSPYRPNPIGLSLVKLSGISIEENEIRVHIKNHDLLDKTPILDIKPFSEFDQPKSDVFFGWQSIEWPTLNISLSPKAAATLQNKDSLKKQIIELLENDPRPAYHRKQTGKNIHGLSLGNYNIKFSIEGSECEVLDIHPIKN